MDAGYRSPLFDLFLRGEIEVDVRRLAARGALTPLPLEQLALLVWLADDPDPEVRSTAGATLSRIPTATLSAFLARTDVPPPLREYFRARGVEAGAPVGAEGTARAAGGDTGDGVAAPLLPEEPPTVDIADTSMAASLRIAKMTVPERIKAAMQGTREERAILVRDPNKLVSAAVLGSPKLAESEVEAISRMTNVSDDVLRTVASSRHWLKSYVIVAGLVKNPKTPIAVSLSLLGRLVERDLRMLSMDRNVPEALRLSARKHLTSTEARKR